MNLHNIIMTIHFQLNKMQALKREGKLSKLAFPGMGLFCFLVLFCCINLIALTAKAQKNKEVIIMDFVKITAGKKAEAMYFYENNWKLYRDAALKNKIIKSYELVESKADSLNNFDLILITVYEDSVQHAKSEENFAPLLKTLRPNGPVLLNETGPNDFRKNVFVKIVSPVFYSPGLK